MRKVRKKEAKMTGFAMRCDAERKEALPPLRSVTVPRPPGAQSRRPLRCCAVLYYNIIPPAESGSTRSEVRCKESRLIGSYAFNCVF